MDEILEQIVYRLMKTLHLIAECKTNDAPGDAKHTLRIATIEMEHYYKEKNKEQEKKP